jgi:hypothetical protein
MMVNTNALAYYNKGIQNAKRGKALLVTGIVLFCGGTICIITNAIVNGSLYYANVGYGRTVDKKVLTLHIEGGVMSGVGLGLGVSGFILRSKAKKNIEQAVNMYNERQSTSHVELGFKAMPNGVSFTLNF